MNDADAVTALILETFRLNGALLAAGDELVRDLELTSARWQVVGAVALAEPALPVAGLARAMGLSRQNVQRIVDELVGSGLLAFAANPAHRRAKLVLLTAAGRGVYAAADRRQRVWAAALARGLPTDAVAAATGLMRGLRERLEDDAGARPPDPQHGES